MPRLTNKTDDATSAQPSLQDALRALIEQQGEIAERIVALAARAEAEIADLKTQAQTSAAELGEARIELAELRAAHEIEMRKRATAEARVVRLRATIAKIRAACADLDGEDAASPVIEAPAEASVEPTAPGTDAVVEGLGLTESDLAVVDMLVRRGEASDRNEMLRTLVRRGLAACRMPAGSRATSGLDVVGGAHAIRS